MRGGGAAAHFRDSSANSSGGTYSENIKAGGGARAKRPTSSGLPRAEGREGAAKFRVTRSRSPREVNRQVVRQHSRVIPALRYSPSKSANEVKERKGGF